MPSGPNKSEFTLLYDLDAFVAEYSIKPDEMKPPVKMEYISLPGGTNVSGYRMEDVGQPRRRGVRPISRAVDIVAAHKTVFEDGKDVLDKEQMRDSMNHLCSTQLKRKDHGTVEAAKKAKVAKEADTLKAGVLGTSTLRINLRFLLGQGVELIPKENDPDPE